MELKDHLGAIQHFPAFTDKSESEILLRKIEKLVVSKLNHEPFSRELSEWIENIPDKLQSKLVKIGLLDSRQATANRPVLYHVEEFEKYLLAKGASKKHATQTTSRVKRVLEDCGFTNWSDINASRALNKISEMKKIC